MPNLMAIFWTMAMCLIAGCSGGSNTAAPSVERVPVEIVTSGGVHNTVKVELARTMEEWRVGLMNRPSMGADEGMLFIFGGEDYRSFWMKDTMISLDMMFIDASLKIIDINENAQPLTTTPYLSSGKAKYVLEVNGGYCAAHGVATGDTIVLPADL